MMAIGMMIVACIYIGASIVNYRGRMFYRYRARHGFIPIRAAAERERRKLTKSSSNYFIKMLASANRWPMRRI